jgi:hypothetical protein
MIITSQTPKVELLLQPRELLTLNHPVRRTTIECKQGTLWVTGSDDKEDHVLAPGQSYLPRNNRKVVIEALDSARLDIKEQ